MKHGVPLLTKQYSRTELSKLAGADPGFPVGGRGPVLGGVDLRRRSFSVKMYVKTKELGLVGGVCRKILHVDPPTASSFQYIRFNVGGYN